MVSDPKQSPAPVKPAKLKSTTSFGANRRLTAISKKLSLLGWLAVKILIPLGVVFCVGYFIWLVCAPATYTLASFKVAKDLERAGYTGEVVRDLFLLHADKIESIANSPAKRVDVLQSTTPKIDFQIPKTTFSFRSLVEWARKVRGAGDVTITVDFIKGADTIRAFAIIEDPKYFGSRTPLISNSSSIEDLVPDIALQVLSRLDPVVGGLYKMSVTTDMCLPRSDCKLEYFSYALKDLNAALTSDRRIHYRALIAIAHVLEATGDHIAAISYLDRAIALDRKQLDAYEFRGVQLFALRMYPDAIANYDKVAAANPTVTALNPNASFLQLDWANALVANNQVKDAIPHYRLSIKDWDGNTEAKAKLAYAFYLDGEYNEALTSFQDVLAVDPFRLQSHNDLANTIRELVVSVRADHRQSKFANCASNDPDPKHYPQFHDAVSQHLYAINHANGNPQLLAWFHEDLSKTYAACGDKELARSEFRLAVQNDPVHELKECGWCG